MFLDFLIPHYMVKVSKRQSPSFKHKTKLESNQIIHFHLFCQGVTYPAPRCTDGMKPQAEVRIGSPRPHSWTVADLGPRARSLVPSWQ